MNNDGNPMIPRYVFETTVASMERTIKRLWILLILLAVLLVGTNAAWLYYEMQFEDTVVEQEIDTGSGDAFVAGVGDVIYGEGKAEGQDP